MVQQWVKELQSAKGLAPSTIETTYVIFASTMRGAVRDGYIRKAPCVDIRLPEKSPTAVRLLCGQRPRSGQTPRPSEGPAGPSEGVADGDGGR
jgi:hypothetical protein